MRIYIYIVKIYNNKDKIYFVIVNEVYVYVK